MSDESIDESGKSELSMGKPIIWISYCPDLGFYHLHREDGEDEPQDNRFTRDELMAMAESLLASGQQAEAQQLALFCGYARVFSHFVVVFYTSGQYRVCRPAAAPEPEQDDEKFRNEFLAIWKKQHPTIDSVPMVDPYPSANCKE